MISIKNVAAATALSTAILSPAAMAGGSLSGNVGVFSEYFFRGVQQADGAAVQGGLDYEHDSGLYIGTWASNVDFYGLGNEYETDLYGGWAGDLGGLSVDLGAIYYYYREMPSDSFFEVYGGLGYGPFALNVAYSPEYLATEDEGFYVQGLADFPLSDTLTLGFSAGYSFGDGFEDTFLGDALLDYSVTLAKDLGNDFEFSFGFVGTDDKDIQKEAFVVGLAKTFDLL